MDDAHAPEIMSGQMNVVKTYLKARYRLSDLLRAQRNDRMTSSLKRWIENGAPDKGNLEEDSYKILKQFYLKRNDLLYLNKDGIVACKRKEEDKVLYKYNSIVLPQLYQTELLFRSHDQMGHQGVDKVYNRIQKRFEWPGLKKACEKWIALCLSCQQAKDPRKLRFPLQSIESSGFNEVVQSVVNLKKFDVTKCPLHANQECIMKRVNELKSSRKLFSMKSETDDGLSSCSNFPERPTETELAANKPVLPEIEHLKGKISDM